MLSSLTEENIQSRNIPLLDRFLENAAEGLGKQVQAMETPREQCRPLNKLSNEQVRRHTLTTISLVFLKYSRDDSEVV